MKSAIKALLCVVYGIGLHFYCSGQSYERILTPEDKDLLSFVELAEKINTFYRNAPKEDRGGYKQWKRQEWFAMHHLDDNGYLADVSDKNWRALREMQTTYATALRSPNGNWTNLDLYIWQDEAVQGRVNSITFDPLNANVAFIATAGGGIWKTDNNGDFWHNVTIDLPILGFADVAVAPVPNTHIIYALPGDNTGGANVYLHRSIGVIKSTDFGATWKKTGMSFTTSQNRQGYKLLVHPTNANSVLAAMSDGIHYSTNGGDSWTVIAAFNSVNDMEFHPNNPNLVYFTILNSNLFYTINLTTTSITNTTVPSTVLPVSRMEIAVTPANPNAVYVQAGPDASANGINTFGGLFVSNNGSPFTLITNVCAGNLRAFGGASWYNNVLFVDPLNANNVMVGGVNLYRATDGGVTLNQVTLNAIHADQHNLKFNPANGQWWLCNDGGVYMSADNGNSWTNKSNGLIIHEYYRISGTNTIEDRLIGGTQDNGHFLRFVANHLHRVVGNDGMDNYFNSWRDSIVYACSQNGGLWRSINWGQTFGPLLPPNDTTGSGNRNFYPWISPLAQHPPAFNFETGQWSNTDIVYLYSLNGILRSSSDNNFSTWTNFGPPGVGQVNNSTNPSMTMGAGDGIASLYITNGNNFWVCDNPLTGDASCWIQRNLPISSNTYTSAIAVNPWNREEVWVTISGYQAGVKVFRTQNAGITWQNLSLGLPNVPVYSIVFANQFSTPSGAVYIGTELGVFYTDDTLPDWVPFTNELPHVAITDLQMNYSTGKLKAATYGRGIWETDVYEACPLAFPLDYPIIQGNYHFEASDFILAYSSVDGGIGTQLRLKAGNFVILQNGFHAHPDTYVRIGIGDCGTGPLNLNGNTPESVGNTRNTIFTKVTTHVD